MRDCLRCHEIMKDDVHVKIAGISLSKLTVEGLGSPKVAVCPRCGEVSIYFEPKKDSFKK